MASPSLALSDTLGSFINVFAVKWYGESEFVSLEFILLLLRLTLHSGLPWARLSS
jgi:amino acid permease